MNEILVEFKAITSSPSLDQKLGEPISISFCGIVSVATYCDLSRAIVSSNYVKVTNKERIFEDGLILLRMASPEMLREDTGDRLVHIEGLYSPDSGSYTEGLFMRRQ